GDDGDVVAEPRADQQLLLDVRPYTAAAGGIEGADIGDTHVRLPLAQRRHAEAVAIIENDRKPGHGVAGGDLRRPRPRLAQAELRIAGEADAVHEPAEFVIAIAVVQQGDGVRAGTRYANAKLDRT